MNKKQLFFWALYDFANSLIYINFVLYFAQWLVVDAGLPDFWYNAIFPVTTVLLLVTAPALAAHTDRHGGRKKYLNVSTVGTFLAYGLAALVAMNGGNVWLAAGLFLVGQYFYQLSFVFYNPMLVDIVDESHRARAYGIGQFASAIGFVVGIAATLPLSDVRTAPLVPAVIAFFLLALPQMLFFKDIKRDQENKHGNIRRETRMFVKKMVAFFAVSAATPMLVAFFFFNDALLTLSNNNAIFMERVFNTPDATKSIVLMGVLVMSAIGGLVAGWLGDKLGVLRTLKFILVAWVIVIPLISLAPSFIFFAVLGSLAGLLIGSVWTVTRTYLTMVLPKEQLGYGFSFYSLAERFATFVGPLTWGTIIWWLGTDPKAYRVAMGTMTIFIVIGLIILQSWKRSDIKPLPSNV